MASHDLSHQPDERLVTEIANLKRQLSEMRTLQIQGSSAVGMAATGVYIATATALINGGAAAFHFALANSQQKMVFATFSYALYQDTAIAANVIDGPNTLGYGYTTRHHTDWQDMSTTFLTQGYTQHERVWVENYTGISHDIIMRAEWRYIVNGGAVTVS